MIKTRGNQPVQNKFHLAIPSNNIEESMKFYSGLGCKIGRYSDKFCIVDFFGTQIVCHKTNELNTQEDIYPRHFGIILDESSWSYICLYVAKLKIKKAKEIFVRHEGTPSEHITFFLQDPSLNYIEFKRYKDERAI